MPDLFFAPAIATVYSQVPNARHTAATCIYPKLLRRPMGGGGGVRLSTAPMGLGNHYIGDQTNGRTGC